MRWENCHEYFLSKEFKDQNPDLSELLESLSFFIRTSNRPEQRRVSMKLIGIFNQREVPKMINEFVGTSEEIEDYLNNLEWTPIFVFSERDGEKVKLITIR